MGHPVGLSSDDCASPLAAPHSIYSPELQPAEHLWPVLDEPLANRYFRYFATLADLERVVTERCRILNRDQLKPGTNFHWWPKPATLA
jgi:transposase